MSEESVLPQWAPRVEQELVRRLYERDAQGIADDALIDEVGYGLLSRCQSFVEAAAAVQGRAPCPVCGRVVYHDRQKATLLRCPCGCNPGENVVPTQTTSARAEGGNEV